MASYEIVLKKGGRIMRRMGSYPSQAAAKNDAQVLADSAVSSVKVYIQPATVKRRNAAYPGDYPADSVLDAGEVYIDKIDALMEQYKGHPNYMKLYGRWERAVNATSRGSVDGAKRAYESALELVPKQNPSSWNQADYRCTAGTEGRLRKAATAKGYKGDDAVMLFAEKVMNGWRKNKRVWNKKTKKWNLIDKKLMQSANFAVNSQAGLYKKNPDWGKVGSAIGRGVKKTGSMIAEGGRRAGEEAKRATLIAKAKDLELCAGRLGINVKDLLNGALDPRATLDQMADRLAEAHDKVSHHSMDIDKRRGSRRSNPSHQSYFTAYTRPESGFRYFSKHNSKTTANKALATYKRRGYSNVRITKSRPKSALPAGLLAKV